VVNAVDAPSWAGPVMLVVGTCAWGASAWAADEPEPVPQEVAVVAIESPPPPESNPVVVVPRAADGSEASEPAEEEIIIEPPEPCAPTVELTFAPGKRSVAVDNDQRIEMIVATAAQWPEETIVLEGYADATGSDLVNLRLSRERAAGVRERLIRRGIDESRLVVQAFGEFRPNISGDVDRDRRVVVRVAGVAQCEREEGKVADEYR